MSKQFIILSLTLGQPLTPVDFDSIHDVSSELNNQLMKKVDLCYASNMDAEKIKKVTELLDDNSPTKILIPSGGFSCLNKRPSGEYGYEEITNSIISTSDSIVLLVVDKKTRGTVEDPIPAFFNKTQFNKKLVLSDINIAEQPVFVEAGTSTPVEAQA